MSKHKQAPKTERQAQRERDLQRKVQRQNKQLERALTEPRPQVFGARFDTRGYWKGQTAFVTPPA